MTSETLNRDYLNREHLTDLTASRMDCPSDRSLKSRHSLMHLQQLFLGANKHTVQLYVMSKCPDAVACENTFYQVYQHLKDSFEIKIDYLGSDGQCKHGPSECLGNIHQLCAHELLPYDDWLSYIHCVDKNFRAIPGSTPSCYPKGQDLSLLDSCIEERGQGLLEASFQRSKIAQKSCTVYIDGQLQGVYDGGRWAFCDGGCTVKDYIKKLE